MAVVRDDFKILRRTVEVQKSEVLKTPPEPDPPPSEPQPDDAGAEPEPEPPTTAEESRSILHVTGTIPAEVWNQLCIRILPKLRPLDDLKVGIDLSATIEPERVQSLEAELIQALRDLDLEGRVSIVACDSSDSTSEGGSLGR